MHPAPAVAWGTEGHGIVTRAALLAADRLPPWFRDAGPSIADLANGPDRWRAEESTTPALAGRAPDHFFDLDIWGVETLPPHRWTYVERAERRGLRPERVGFLPFAILETYGILVSAFRDARARRPGGREAALVAAGILSHLAGDAAVPLHATRHHHGWVGRNPEGFTRAGTVHRWFETDLVYRVAPASVRAGPAARERLADVPAAVHALLTDSLAQVPSLYRLERERPGAGQDPPAVKLVRERLAAGATLLARLWSTAWMASAR
jgi:hypothetical protein